MLATLLLAALLAGTPEANAGLLEKLFAPKARLWGHWAQHQPRAENSIDHRAWGAFLEAYLIRGADGINRVDYGSVSAADRSSLKAYIRGLQSTVITGFSRPQQFAYWINLYNAVTVDLVLDHYPVDTIRDIALGGGLFGTGPWTRKLLEIEGRQVSLNDIEHRILRPIWKDPRIHYAVNCASLGCPNLAAVAFTPENSDRLLESGAAAYVNHPRGVEFRQGKLWLSSIYSWFEGDFGGGKRGVFDHIKRYAEPGLAAGLEPNVNIGGYQYDWSLNDAP